MERNSGNIDEITTSIFPAICYLPNETKEYVTADFTDKSMLPIL